MLSTYNSGELCRNLSSSTKSKEAIDQSLLSSWHSLLRFFSVSNSKALVVVLYTSSLNISQKSTAAVNNNCGVKDLFVQREDL